MIMLLVLFSIGNDRYALDSTQIVEIIPLVSLKKIPHAPEPVAGLLHYRGQLVPVIDLSQLIQGRPCRHQLNTRILLVHYPDRTETSHILGLLAERVTETIQKNKKDFLPSGVTVTEAPYLGRISPDEQGMIQCVLVEHLLPDSLRACLFAPAREQR